VSFCTVQPLQLAEAGRPLPVPYNCQQEGSERMQMNNLRNAFRYGLVAQRLLERLKAVGLEIVVYYLVAEGDFQPPPGWGAGFARFRALELGVQDMPELVPTRPWISLPELLQRLQAGHICIGLREEGRLAAYAWADPHQCSHRPNQFTLAPGAAYLYEAYTMPAYRGRDLAPYMRERCYALLRSRGFDTFYSITDYFNTAASRFKQKLGARPLQLHLYVSLARRWQHNWTLKSWVPVADR
jgi:GNAT superfamily N-acetyltransferase